MTAIARILPLVTLAMAAVFATPHRVLAQNTPDARALVARAAEALGGAERIRAVRTIRLRGYGHEAYQDGGSNITTEPTAPEKMTILAAYERVIDLQNGRTRVKSRQSRAFIFAALAMMEGRPVNQSLDGDVAYDTGADGATRRVSAEAAARRRMELLANPVVAVREALDSRSRLANQRTEGTLTLVDVTTGANEKFTIAFDGATSRPAWVRWVSPHENLGEIVLRAEFSAYEPVGGIQLPMSFNTVSDWRNTVMLRLHVDRYELDVAADDLAASAAVRSAPAPVPAYRVDATDVSPGVWLLSGNGGANSVLLEFADHLSLFEVPTSRGWTEALIAKARTVVPGKPLTEAIITHHHFDHTGGLRSAIAAGLTIIAQAGNAAWYEQLSHRTASTYPDALSRNPQPLKLRTFDDHLRLSDAKLTVDLYRIISNNHIADGLMGYVPSERLLLQGDLFDVNWEVYFWGTTYADNVAYRKLDVARDVSIHGRVLPIAEVKAKLAEQTANAAALCKRVETAGLSMPGCPLAWSN